jgi:hypothetical protein
VKKRKGKKTMLLLMTDPAKQLMKREQKTKKSDLDPHHHPSPNAQATEVVETEISIESATANERVLEITNHRTSTARATAPTGLDRGAATRVGIVSTDSAAVVTTLNPNRTTTWKRMY